MGRAFAARAIETGHQTTVWNRTPGRAAALVASGAVEADPPATAASGADAVLVVLADDTAVVDVCLGDDGVLASLEPDAVCANVSTVSPETARRLAELGPDGRVLDRASRWAVPLRRLLPSSPCGMTLGPAIPIVGRPDPGQR